jgi:GNAT superfamily N-acetyltransferase
MAEFTIRNAEPRDDEQIAGLLGELGYPHTPGFVQEKVARIAASDDDILFVAETMGIVIGAAHLHIAEMIHEEGRLGRIMALIVTNKYRWMGVGKKLIAVAEKTARDKGCSKMEVTSAMRREPAKRFYEGLGYEEKRRRFLKDLPGRS